MEITEVKVFPIREQKLKAFVSIVLDDCFMVNDIKIIRGRDGRFISMPSRKKKNGDFKDVAHPLNNQTRRMMEDRILAEYDRVVAAREAKEKPREEPARQQERRPEAAAESENEESTPEESEDRSLKEVAEEHLSESFWTS